MLIKDKNKCNADGIELFLESKEYQKQAKKEGWGLFECFGSTHGKWQVQHFDEGPLKNDAEAWDIIVNGDKPHHKSLLYFIRYFNPSEYNRIVKIKRD